MEYIVTIKVSVKDANDSQNAIYRAVWRIKDVTPTGIIEDKYADIDRSVQAVK